MNRTRFHSIARVSLPYAVSRAKAYKIPQAVIDLWIINHRAVAARITH